MPPVSRAMWSRRKALTAADYTATYKNNVNIGTATVTITGKEQSKATGYLIYYTTDKKFKKSIKKVTIKKAKTVKYTIKKLKSKKTYYVKLRAYKKVGTKTFYGAYTKVYKVKVK